MDPNWRKTQGTRSERILAALKAGGLGRSELRARFGHASITVMARLCREGLVEYDKNEMTFRLAAAPAQGRAAHA